MKIPSSLFLLAFVCAQFLYSQDKPNEISDPRGAIIIADMKGVVVVTNNSTGEALPAESVQAGKILFDGHTIKTTGKGSIIVLLLSNGTVTTLKADSILNIKKFTQSKFDAGATKLSELEGEPSASETLIDLNIGDMVVDIKKLDKKSNFNIESPVGTAGIRGTRIGMQIAVAPGGGFTSKVTVPEGVIAFTPPAPPPAPGAPPGSPPPPPPEPVAVSAGQAVTPSVTATGTVSAPPVPVPAPPADLAAVNADLDVAVAGTAEITVAEIATAVETVAEVAPPPEAAAPTESEPTEPEPTESEPTEPEPTEPEPTEPEPTEPEPTEPSPTDPEPTEPTPTEPTPTEPTPTEPTPTEPGPPPTEPGGPPSPDGPAVAPPPGPGPDAPPPPPPPVEAPQVDQTALRESNPVIKAKQMGIKADDPKAAALANAFVEEKGLSADILSSAEGMKSFVDIFDIEDGQATQMRKMGVDMRNVEIGDSLGELVAAAGLLATANKNIKSGAVRVEDAADYAKKLVMNLGDSAKTFAKAAETGTPLDENFQNNLIKNADKAEEIGNVDFTDPMALKIVDLKAKFPEYSTAIDNNKEFAQQILDLVAVVGSVTGTDVFKPGVLELYLDPEIQDLGQQLDHGYLRLLVSDPDFFRNLLPILKSNTQLPSELFVELKNLNLTASELSKVLSDIQVGPKATPPGSPPSQVAQLTLQDEAGMLGLLDNRSFTGGVIDPVLFAASDQVLASVFFTETSDAYTALSDLDRSQHSDGAGDDFKELILGAKEISFSSGVYALDSASPVDFLVASSDKLTLTGNVIFNPSSADSGLILLSAGTVDLSGASSISFGGDELGIGSFDSLEVKNVDLKSEDQISLRSLDSIVINNSKMETSGKGADFVHLLAANELQVNNLRFSESVKRIAMEAMTINLSNVNFPSSSTVNLNSIYGGIDGKYPHFNSIQHGRVNFIEKIRYGSHLIMDRAAFDAHGGNITIGTSN